MLQKLTPALLSMFLISITATPLMAQVDPWTSTGSTGTVDEADTGLVVFGSPPAIVTMGAGQTGVLNIRYNVVAVDGLFGGDNYVLSARFRDTGTTGQVIARLKQFNMNTGVTTTLLTLDSNAFAASANYQVQSIGSPCSTGLNFFENSYFVDVEITKTAGTATPALGMLRIGLSLC